MVAFLSRQRLNLPVAPLAAGIFALFTALLFALMPSNFLENLALDSGLAAVLPAAEPPLGFTARAVLILIGGGGVGAVAWLGLFLLVGSRTVAVAVGKPLETDDVPVLRRADAHPDAPPRRPLLANRDLGTPFLDVHAGRDVRDQRQDTVVPVVAGPPPVQSLPADLDLPLAAFDPAAIPDEPIDWFPSPAPLNQTPLTTAPRRQVYEPGERFETFALSQEDHTSAPRPIPRPVIVEQGVDFDASASIHALLDRLERGVSRREPAPVSPPPPPAPAVREESLEDALVSLRRLAVRG